MNLYCTSIWNNGSTVICSISEDVICSGNYHQYIFYTSFGWPSEIVSIIPIVTIHVLWIGLVWFSVNCLQPSSQFCFNNRLIKSANIWHWVIAFNQFQFTKQFQIATEIWHPRYAYDLPKSFLLGTFKTYLKLQSFQLTVTSLYYFTSIYHTW